jgi:hypothetical protein
MNKFIKYFLIISLAISCSISEENKLNFSNISENQSGSDYYNERFKINIKHVNYNNEQNNKLEAASELLEKIFNSIEYKYEILNFTHRGEKKFHDNQGKSNLEIYKHLMKGAEILMPIENNQMDLTVRMYYSLRSTVGYTYPHVLTVYTNSRFYNRYSACQVASNLAHEWTHKMGYGHSQKWNHDRDFTVPYGHNKIVEKLCPLALEGKLTFN